jgi:hypothetical protein
MSYLHALGTDDPTKVLATAEPTAESTAESTEPSFELVLKSACQFRLLNKFKAFIYTSNKSENDRRYCISLLLKVAEKAEKAETGPLLKQLQEFNPRLVVADSAWWDRLYHLNLSSNLMKLIGVLVGETWMSSEEILAYEKQVAELKAELDCMKMRTTLFDEDYD